MVNIRTLRSTSVALLPFQALATSKTDFLYRALNATDVLNEQYYNHISGLWQNFWWNSGAILSTIGDVALLYPDFKTTAKDIFSNTLFAAKASNNGDFLNEYYDDEGWWAMGWIKAYDITKEVRYLHEAQTIHLDLLTSLTTRCHNGGNWWSKTQDSLPSISAQLYLAVTASLANRLAAFPRLPTTADVPDYTALALSQADWLLSCGMRNENGTFNDGLSLSTCAPIGPVYSYNQGVILGALVELAHLTSNETYLDLAASIAHAGIAALATPHGGILTEIGSEEGMDPTGAQFKGVFVRNLGYLNVKLGGVREFENFLRKNADSVWDKARDDQGRIGSFWQGPVMSLSASSQGSGIDCLVAAAGVKGRVVVHGGSQ
ncbi:unnamed protein product [Zymoseptoria tritici ST99CH_1A5]|uniref:Glycoside hydrolase family 76 protein n=1 Tax=Zymoseptoria tritici ST99CH_1A5 TaxID=1276529 RepID=A0A1Y6M1F0_ZYMTR|nr:unnamed protein product [Zymoseptoria tritici ST99CH_1A5]